MSESKAAPPRGIRLTPLDPSFRNDPYSVLKSLREHDPVMRDDEFGRWFLTRFDDVSHLLRDKHTSVNPRSGNLPPTYSARMQRPDSPQSRTGVLSSIIFLDDPAHRRLRGLVSKAFTPGAVEALRPRVRAIVRELLAAIREREFELVGTFAAPLTAAVTAELLEIDPADRSAFGSWSELLVTSFYNPFLSPAKVALAASARRMLEEYLSALIARRRQHPTSDLITAMLNVHDAENRLTDDEIVQQCSLLILAGQVTTTDAIGNGVKALIEHPQELAKLRARGDLIDSAVEEMLRYDAPTVSAFRVVQKEISLGGCRLSAGDSVTLSLAAANHDPAVNPNPECFDLERQNVRHQSFGGGKHVCLGAPLARLQMREAISALLARFPELRASSRGLRYRPMPALRGMSEYWLES